MDCFLDGVIPHKFECCSITHIRQVKQKPMMRPTIGISGGFTHAIIGKYLQERRRVITTGVNTALKERERGERYTT